MAKNKIFSFITVTNLLWFVYFSLLVVMTPHNAWTASQMFGGDKLTGWAFAVAFELVIAGATHKLVRRLESKAPKGWRGTVYHWANGYSALLMLALVVSGLANLAFVVQFGAPLSIFATWGIPAWVYSVAFGGILPVSSLMFAVVLSDEVKADEEPNAELSKANETIRELNKRLREAERARAESEQRFAALGDMFVHFQALFADDKRRRIEAVAQLWPHLLEKPTAAGLIVDASAAYVSEVFSAVRQEAKQ